MLSLDSSYESEDDNPLKALEAKEAAEFYNMVRAIFNSANINIKNEQLYSPILEALIKNYSNKLKKKTVKKESLPRDINDDLLNEDGEDSPGRNQNVMIIEKALPTKSSGKPSKISHLYTHESPVKKHQPMHVKLLDINSLSTLRNGWSTKNSTKTNVNWNR